MTVVLLAFVLETDAMFHCCDIALTSVCPLSSWYMGPLQVIIVQFVKGQ